MNKIAKFLVTTALCALTIFATGCGSDKQEAKKADPNAPIKIGVTAGPHAEIMDNVKTLAEKQGVKIEVVEFADFVSPNVALSQNELFANSMQHAPYLKATLEKEPKFELVEVFKTVNFPMAIYSTKHKNIADVPEGAIIGIPNDPSNGARALLMLADKGFIQLKDNNDINSSVASITSNPKNYQIRELDAASIPKAMPDLDLAVINANYALVANLNPSRDSLMIERSDNPFVNIFVTTKSNLEDKRLATIQKIYQSEDNKKFIEEHFKGSITAAF